MSNWLNKIHVGDSRWLLPAMALDGVKVNCCVTSPPYWGLRDYGHENQIGQEAEASDYVTEIVEVFKSVRRLLSDDGTVWLNLGDSYGHGTTAKRMPSLTSTKISADQHKAQGNRHGGVAKQLMGIPWRVAFALQEDGWILRQEIIWDKPNAMPESVTDRCVKSHEHMFILTKSPRYWFDHEAVKELSATGIPRNRRSVWSVPTKAFAGAHFATFPTALVMPCILAGCPEGGTVLDPFMGSGTVARVAADTGRDFIGCELVKEYADLCFASAKETQHE